MGILLIIAVLVLLAFANVRISSLLLRRQAGRSWWFALGMAWLAGAVFGVWSGFFLEYCQATVILTPS